MESLANPRKTAKNVESFGKLRPTLAESLDGIPLAGAWSHGPVYHRLDSDFLAQPQIPKAPPTPRMQIDRIDGAVRVVDRFAQLAATDPVPPGTSEGVEPHATTLPGVRMNAVRPRFEGGRSYQLIALAIGFGAGIAAAALLRLF